jgi:hypothetical protein
MKPIIILLSLFCCNGLFAQNNDLLELVFADSSNIAELDGKRPSKYLVLDNTQEWDGNRFKLKENVRLDSVRRKLERNEHHPYNHSYLFKDSLFSQLFSDEEKEYLFSTATKLTPRTVNFSSQNIRVIKSFKALKNGFFFSISAPVYTSDSQFVFIDITVYDKEKAENNIRNMAFGSVVLVYQNIAGKWIRINKKEHLIL